MDTTTTRYLIAVRGRLSERFASAFVGTAMELGDGVTRLVTEPFDDRQLGELLRSLSDLGVEVVRVEAVSA